MRLTDAVLADIRRRNPVADVVQKLGLELHRVGRTLMGACPICGGGRSAQRFEIKDDETWVCAVCADGGDVIRLIEKAQGLDFRRAVEWLGVEEVDPAEAERLTAQRQAKLARREAEAEKFRAEERERLLRLWDRAFPAEGSPVEAYLRGRCIFERPDMFKFVESMPFFRGEVLGDTGRREPRVIHRGPAMLAQIRHSAVGNRQSGAATADCRLPTALFGLHITWFDPARPGAKATIADPETGEILPAKKVRGDKLGGWIELLSPAASVPHRMFLGEGIETVLSVHEVCGRAAGEMYRSGVDLGNIGGAHRETIDHPTLKHGNGHKVRLPGPEPDMDGPEIPMPDSVTELVLLGDGDSDRFSTETALRRAVKRYARPGRKIRIAWAPDGKDFNDVLREAA